MYKYQGLEYTLDEVTQAANDKNLTVDEYVNQYGLETTGVTNEIQEPVTEGKTNGAAAEGATATPETGQAPESMELELVDTSLESQQIDNSPEAIFKRRKQAALDQAAIDQFGEIELEEVVVTADDSDRTPEDLLDNIQKIDDRIKLLAGEDMQVDPLDSPKRIEEYNNLVNRRKQVNKTLNEKLKKEGSVKSLYRVLRKADKGLGEFILSIPSFVYEIGSLVSDPINRAFGLQETNLQKFEESIGTRPLLDGLIEEQKKLATIQEQYKDLYDIKGGITENFKKGNWSDGFYLLGETLAESAPISLSLMVGGAAGLSRTALTIGGGVPIAAGEMRTQLEEYPEDTKGEMLLKSTLIGLSEGFFEGVFGAGAAGKVYKNMVKDLGEEQAKKTFKQSITSMYEGALQKSGVPLSMVGNGLEEAATQATQNIVNGKPWNEGISDAFAAGVGGGALYGAPVNLAKGVQLGRETYQSIKTDLLLKPTEFKSVSQAFATDVPTTEAQIKISQSPNAEKVLVRQLKRDVQKGNLTIEQANEIESNFRQTQGAVNQLKPLNLSEQDQGEIVELIKEKNKLQQEIKQVNESALTEPQDQRVKEINDLLRDFSAKARIKETAKIESIAKQMDKVGVKTLSTEEIQSYLQNNNLVETQEDAIKKSGEGAFIVQNPDTKEQEIIVNKDIGSISDPSHEALHALIFQTVRKSPDTARRLGESLQEQLNKINPNLIEDSGIRERLELYNQDPTAVQMEEVLTLFSDTIRSGAVKFNDNVFTKIGDFIRQFLSTLGVKAKFNNGRDVYNFIKDYNKSIESGKLTRGQVRAAKEGVTGRLVGPKIETFAETPTVKETRIEDQAERNKELMQRAKEGDVLAANDLVQENSGLILRLLKFNPDVAQQSGVTSDDILQAVTDMATPGMVDLTFPGRKKSLVEEYKESDGEVTTFLGRLRQRQAEIYTAAGLDPNKFTTERIDAPEARQVAAEEVVVTEALTKPEVKAIDPFRIMPDIKETATVEVQKSIADKDIDVTTVTYKELKDVAPYQTVADFFDIPVSRITNPKDNLRKSDDVANIQRWILKNEPTLKNLFTEANREVVEIKEGNRVIRKGGEPTAIPRNLLNTFYTKGDRVGNNFQWTLKPYDRTTFLEAVGIKDGKVDPNFTPRAAEAQTIKGILDMYTRNLGNIIARETIEAREDIAPAEKARAKAEVAKGKPRLMFSKKVDGTLTQGQSQNIGKVFNKLSDQEKITFVQNIDPFFDAITKDDYNVETAFNNIFGPDFLKGKKKQDFINEWSKVRGSIVDLKNYNKGKPKQTTVQDYLYQAFEEQTQEEVVENILGIKKGGVNFRSKDRLMGYVNFINSYIAKKAESLNDFELAEFVINDLGPTLSAGAKVGGNDFMWQRDPDTNLLALVPSTLDRSNSIRTSLFGNQKEMAEVLIKPFISDQTKLTYEGNKPLWEGKPLLKKGYKVDQSVSTYLTSIKKNREITPALLQKSEEYAAKQVENIFDILDYYKSLPKNSEVTIDDLGMFFRAANGDMTAMVRAAANVDSFAGDGAGAYRYEHNPPARTMLVRMAEYINGTITRQELKNEFNKYTVSIIPQQMDDVVNERYKDTVPLVGSRYYNAFTYGRFPFAMNVYKKQNDGSYKKETIGEYQKEAYENQIKLAKINNNKLGSIKFSKKVDNAEVLNRMSELDNQAKEANKQLFDSADLNKGFNDILEQTTGIASEKRYKRVKAEVAGAARGRVFRGIPYSAQDLVGLLYETLGKGKLGDAQMAWWTENLLKPYAKAMNEIDAARLSMLQDYRALKRQLKVVPKDLRKKIPGEPFTREQAVRVYIWNTQGMEVPGISETDLKDLTDFVENNEELKTFADQIIYIQKGDEYAKPKEGWPAGSITTDLLESINTVKRAKYLEQWQANVDVIFSEENMNKLEAAYGKKYRKAMENMLERMKTGRNRRFSDDSLTGRFTDWLQGSIGTIMFFNTRSALLQTISSINFVNFTDNNPLAAAKAFGNQKQFWSDFVTLINSDFLKARRSGLRMNVNEADIADMAKKGGPRAVINKLLQLGFAPTQIADSFAIASGGATFYRNRINTYKKQGLSQQEAETKAFEDFRENAEESQQSARPDRISMQQAGPLGRLILAFQNTPSQYARIIDKSIRDLKNGRGDAKTNISKIIYYSTVQNLLFNALQQALFAFAFGDEEPEDKEKEKKYVDIANSMMDSLLRGTGVAGGVVSVTKNAILRIIRESEKDRPKYEKVGADLIKIAPPISSKLSKINQAARSYEWDKEEMKKKGWSLDNPAYLAGANVISALTNIPLDRGIKKANNVVNATDSDLETWERLALLGGWQDWEIGIDEEEKAKKPKPKTIKRKTVKRKTITR